MNVYQDSIIKVNESWLPYYAVTHALGGILDKNSLGSGGTYSVLNSDDNWVVAVPARAAVLEDRSFKHVFSVVGETKTEDIKAAVLDDNITKFIVTYDSEARLRSILAEEASEWFILIDEVHMVVDAIDFRDTAINRVVDSVYHYKNFVYLTGTIGKAREFLGLDVTTINWGNPERWRKKIKAKKVRSSSKVSRPLEASALLEAEAAMEDHEKVYIYYNNVSGILRIAKQLIKLGVDPEDILINCSAEKEDMIKLKHPNIVNVNNDVDNKIILTTQVGFESVSYDIGKVIIVVDRQYDFTTLFILTTLIQIMGRNRGNGADLEGILLYNAFDNYVPNLFDKQAAIKEIEAEDKLIKSFKAMVYAADGDGNMLKLIRDDFEGLRFYEGVRHNGDILKTYTKKNGLLKGLGLYTTMLEESKTFYSNLQLGDKHILSDILTIERVPNDLELSRIDFDKAVKGVDKYLELRQALDDTDTELINYYEKYEPWLFKTIVFGGIDMPRTLGYSVKAYRKFVQEATKEPYTNRVNGLLSERGLSEGMIIPVNEIKDTMQDMYDYIGWDKKAKATDINTYFSTKRSGRRIEGKDVRCFKLILKVR